MTTGLVIFALTYLLIAVQRLPFVHLNRPAAAAGAADAVPHRSLHGLKRGLRAVGHGDPAEHARRDLERRDVRRVPRPHAAGRAGRARHHVRLAALGLRRGAARAVPRAPRGGAGGTRPAARHPGAGGGPGGPRPVGRPPAPGPPRHLRPAALWWR